MLQLRQGHKQVVRYLLTGDLHQRRAGIKQKGGGGVILLEVELPCRSPVMGLSPQPNDDDTVGDLRRQQQGGRHIDRAAHGGDHQRFFRRIPHGAGGQIPGGPPLAQGRGVRARGLQQIGQKKSFTLGMGRHAGQPTTGRRVRPVDGARSARPGAAQWPV